MWTRRELKEKAKPTFRANYWKAVLVALLVSAIAGGGSSISAATSASIASSTGASTMTFQSGPVATQTVEETVIYDDTYYEQLFENTDWDDINSVPEIISMSTPDSSSYGYDPLAVGITVTLVFLPIVLIAVVLAGVTSVFIFNPLAVGTKRFFLVNLNQPAEVRECARAFDVNYRECVRTMFFADLKIFLWSLLLIIPGIVKSYEYRMIPYLLADDPTMDSDRAFAESKALMQGNKLKAFVLDLSFIGWHILSLFTLGLLDIFYVSPYVNQTNAALYERLRYGTPELDAPAELPDTEPIVPDAPVA